MLTFVGKEKAFFAKTFGRSNQVPSDAEGSSDGGPIPRIEQLLRRKKDVKTKVALRSGLHPCIVPSLLMIT